MGKWLKRGVKNTRDDAYITTQPTDPLLYNPTDIPAIFSKLPIN